MARGCLPKFFVPLLNLSQKRCVVVLKNARRKGIPLYADERGDVDGRSVNRVKVYEISAGANGAVR